MKKQSKLTKKQIEAIIYKICEAIEFIDNNAAYLNKLQGHELYGLQSAINTTGYTLVQTSSLADYYKAETFCNDNGLEIVNHNF